MFLSPLVGIQGAVLNCYGAWWNMNFQQLSVRVMLCVEEWWSKHPELEQNWQCFFILLYYEAMCQDWRGKCATCDKLSRKLCRYANIIKKKYIKKKQEKIHKSPIQTTRNTNTPVLWKKGVEFRSEEKDI